MENKNSNTFPWLTVLFYLLIVFLALALILCFFTKVSCRNKSYTQSNSAQIAEREETANWKTYQWEDMSFKYPLEWTIKEEYYATPAMKAEGIAPEIIGLLVYSEAIIRIDGANLIYIDGRQNSCDPAQSHIRCNSEGSHVIFTDSIDPEVQRVFELLVSTINITNP